MNALTLLALFLATIVAVSCGPHHLRHRSHHKNKNVGSLSLPTTLKVQHHRIPAHIRQQMPKNNKFAHVMDLPEELQHQLQTKTQKLIGANLDAAAENGSTHPITLENWNDWLLLANVSVGTPPQTVRVAFSIYDSNMYVIGVGAVEKKRSDYSDSSNSGSTSVEETPKNTYNASASSTSTVEQASFTGDYGEVKGVLVNDNVNLGGLTLNITLGDVNEYDWWLGYLPIDGVIGISTDTNLNGIPNSLSQITSQLEKPLVVLNTRRNYDDDTDGIVDPTEVNEITFGTDKVAGCSDNWSISSLNVSRINKSNIPLVGLTKVSVDLGANGGLSVVNASHVIIIDTVFAWISISNQVETLFINASGAQLNSTSDLYQIPCDQVAQGKNVVLGLEDGTAITLTPQDYTIRYQGQCYLYVYGHYDEDDAQSSKYPIILGQAFLNNHCIGYNPAANTMMLADKSV